MIQFLKSLFVGAPVERAIIDARDPTLEEARNAMRRSLERQAADAADRQNVARSIKAFARETIDKRGRPKLPVKLPKNIPIVLWLPGLSIAELTNLKTASDDEIEEHVFYGYLIPGVRAVQSLEEAVLRFPTRIRPAEEHERAVGGGGGPRRPR